ncbi:MAG TPA: AraC family transcriptional regulator [Feifaniaceae bacterium]|nr:AraC family transcriptional regulator [Feifaniaceae bacterium]
MKQIAEERVYGIPLEVLSQEGLCSLYRMRCLGGTGCMKRYALLPGVDLVYSRYDAESCLTQSPIVGTLMEINHCRCGRFECEFRRGSYAYLAAGDICVNMMARPAASSGFPLSVYEGASVILDLPAAQQAFTRAFPGIRLDLNSLRRRLCGEGDVFVNRSTPAIAHAFNLLYAQEDALNTDYALLKVLEILLLLRDMPEERPCGVPYFRKEIALGVRALRDDILRQPDVHLPIGRLCARYSMGSTLLKSAFKAIYGQTIYAFLRECRMQAAAASLEGGRKSIAAIAADVGYENASKFSAAFRGVMGVSPSQYRQSRRMRGL